MSTNTDGFIRSIEDLKGILKNGKVFDVSTPLLREKWIFTKEFRTYFLDQDIFDTLLQDLDFTFENYFNGYSTQQQDRLNYYRVFKESMKLAEEKESITLAEEEESIKVAEEASDGEDEEFYNDNYNRDYDELYEYDELSDYEEISDCEDGDLIPRLCKTGGLFPPFVSEEYLSKGKKYKVSAPYFFNVEGEFFYILDKKQITSNRDQSGNTPPTLICRLSSISFPEFLSAILWNIFSNRNKPEVAKISSGKYVWGEYAGEWVEAFFRYFLDPCFFYTLSSLNLTFSSEEYSKLQFELGWVLGSSHFKALSSGYKDSARAPRFTVTLCKVLTVIGVDSDKARELSSEYTSTWDTHKFSQAVYSEALLRARVK